MDKSVTSNVVSGLSMLAKAGVAGGKFVTAKAVDAGLPALMREKSQAGVDMAANGMLNLAVKEIQLAAKIGETLDRKGVEWKAKTEELKAVNKVRNATTAQRILEVQAFINELK